MYENIWYLINICQLTVPLSMIVATLRQNSAA